MSEALEALEKLSEMAHATADEYAEMGGGPENERLTVIIRAALEQGEAVTVTAEMVRAALESQARDSDGEFPPLIDLLNYSGSDKARAVARAALEAALEADPPSTAEQVVCPVCDGDGIDPEPHNQLTCCGNPDPNQECCNCPIMEQIPQPCRQCDGFGRIYAAPPSTAEAQTLKRAARYLRKNSPADESSIKDLIEAAEHIEKHGEWPADRIEEYEAKRIREAADD